MIKHKDYYKLYKDISPFFLKDILINFAKGSDNHKILNAGRGNPNFFNKFVRKVFNLLSTILLDLTYNVKSSYDDLVYYKTLSEFKDLYKSVKKRVNESDLITNEVERTFILNYLEYLVKQSKKQGINPQKTIYNLITSIYGCFYPTPPRLQPHLEFILGDYMFNLIYNGVETNDKPTDYDYFATEGAAAGILYAFNTLAINKLLVPGDTIAIITPIFSPYLEMPKLKAYGLNIVELRGRPEDNYALTNDEIDKLKNPEIKGLFCVNPTNPSAFCLPESNIKRIGKIVSKYRNDLIIVSDCVYSPFVKKFNSLLQTCPRNTIEIYSLSKYFGTTGWRLGVTMIRKDNNFNYLFKALSTRNLKELNHRYGLVSLQPNSLDIMDRIVMDSRQVAEEHVGGLSTPQQVIMGMFLFYDFYEFNHGPIIGDKTYKQRIHSILDKRIDYLYKPLGIKPNKSDIFTEYYTLLPIIEIADKLFDGKGKYLKKHSNYIDFLAHLAKTYHVVLLPGKGFGSGPWYLRVSLANLPDEKYKIIGKAIYKTIRDILHLDHLESDSDNSSDSDSSKSSSDSDQTTDSDKTSHSSDSSS